jgi:phage protein U
MPWATLGDIAFQLLLPAVTSAELTEGFRFVEHERIGRKPALQFTGPTRRRVALTVALSRAFGDPEAELAKLRAAAAAAQVLPFTWGHGEPAGDFVVEEVTVRLQKTQADGRVIAMELDLKLTEHAGPTTKPPAPAVKKR